MARGIGSDMADTRPAFHNEKKMRLLNFQFGDLVRIKDTNLTGTVIRTGGTYAVVEFVAEGKKDAIRIPLTRLRHTEKWSKIALKSFRRQYTKLKRTIQYYINEL